MVLRHPLSGAFIKRQGLFKFDYLLSKNDATNSFDLLMWEKLFDYSILDNSVIGYITPKDKLDSREKEIFAGRNRKLEHAREIRK